MFEEKQASRIRRQMTVSVAGSFFFGQIASAGSVFMTSFILFLGGSTADIGHLSGIPQLTGVLQLFSVLIYRRLKSRKRVVLALGVIKYIFFYGLFLIPWLPLNLRMKGIMALLISGFAVQALTGAGITEWNDFFVPDHMKGRYYSNRNLLFNLSAVIVALFVGQILTWMGETLPAYYVILGISLVFSVTELLALVPAPDVKDGLDTQHDGRLHLMLEPLKDRPYRYYMIFTALWNFGLLLGQPYQTYYSLKELNLSVAFVTGVASVVSFLKLLSAKAWGASVDKLGGRHILVLAGFVYALSGGLWAFLRPQGTALYAVVTFITGMVMIGTNISIFNINITLSPTDKRVSYFGVNGAVTGVVAYAAPSLGAWFLTFLSRYTEILTKAGLNPYTVLFLSGAAIQTCSLLFFVLKSRESKKRFLYKNAEP